MTEASELSCLEGLYIKTPIIESAPLGKLLSNHRVVLKLDNCQNTGSFKNRGLSCLCVEAKKHNYTTVVCASGGNAGDAAAYSAQKLNMKAIIVMPENSTEELREKIRSQGATVIVHGANFNAADCHGRELAQRPGHVYVHPFNNPTIWDGHASMVIEMKAQMSEKPSAIVCCVGGGGLLYGILRGIDKVGWADVPVIAMETKGAESFNASVVAGKLVRLEEITSIAVTLGSVEVIPELLDECKTHNIISGVVEDKEAVDSCLQFLDHHRILVEPSCGAALAAVYTGLVERLFKEGTLQGDGPVVVIVCGGSGVTLAKLLGWKERFNL